MHHRLRQRARLDDAGEVALEQRDAGAFDRHIGAGAHGDADVGGGQRRGVVDAVAGHGDHAALAAQLLDHGALLVRQDFRLDLGNAQALGDGECGGAVVAGEHHHAHAVGGQCSECRRCGGFDRVGDRDDAGQLAVHAEEYGGGAVAAQALGFSGERRCIDIQFG